MGLAAYMDYGKWHCQMYVTEMVLMPAPSVGADIDAAGG